MNYSKINRRTNKEIHRLSLKIGNGITDKELSNLIKLVKGQLINRASKIIKLNNNINIIYYAWWTYESCCRR